MLEAQREVAATPGFASEVSLVKSKSHCLFPLHKAVAPTSLRAKPKGPAPGGPPCSPLHSAQPSSLFLEGLLSPDCLKAPSHLLQLFALVPPGPEAIST